MTVASGEGAAGDTNSPSDLWGLGDDDAITNPAQDAFGRASFARHLADVIRAAPETASFRIGLFGEWGEGKTSVMAMVEHYLGDAYISVRISAWDAADANDVVRRVATALAKEARVDQTLRAQARAAVNHAAGKLAALRKLAANGPALVKGVDAVVGEVVEHAVEGKLDEYRQYDAARLIREANAALGARRAVVFVDDLDRADPATLPRVLMALRDAVPVAGLVFVLALSTGAVRSGLAASGYGLETPERFLEKIVEYPAYLPALSAAESERYAARRIAEIVGLREPGVLRDLARYLPTNPRRLKRFLRLLAANRATFARFGDDEVDWRTLYACQLLLAEFPEHARRLRANPDALAAMKSHFLEVHIHRRNPRAVGSEPRPPEEDFAPAEGPDRARFLELFRLVRESFNGSRYSLGDLLSLTDAPPSVTAREVDCALDALADAGSADRPDAEWSRGLKDLIAGPEESGEAERGTRARAIWSRVVERLRSATQAGRRAHAPAERLAFDATARRMRHALAALVDPVGAFRHGWLGATEWKAWLEEATARAETHRARGDGGALERELAILPAALAGAPDEVAEAGYAALKLRAELTWQRRPDSAQVANVLATIMRTLDERMLDSVLARLERSGGPRVYETSRWDEHGKLVVFTPDSPLYGPEGIRRLATLADAAATRPAIQANFIELVELMERAVEGRLVDLRGGYVALIPRNPAVMEILWRGATAGEVTDTAAHDLRLARATLLGAGASEAAMPVPDWWSVPPEEADSDGVVATAAANGNAEGTNRTPAVPPSAEVCAPAAPPETGGRA